MEIKQLKLSIDIANKDDELFTDAEFGGSWEIQAALNAPDVTKALRSQLNAQEEEATEAIAEAGGPAVKFIYKWLPPNCKSETPCPLDSLWSTVERAIHSEDIEDYLKPSCTFQISDANGIRALVIPLKAFVKKARAPPVAPSVGAPAAQTGHGGHTINAASGGSTATGRSRDTVLADAIKSLLPLYYPIDPNTGKYIACRPSDVEQEGMYRWLVPEGKGERRTAGLNSDREYSRDIGLLKTLQELLCDRAMGVLRRMSNSELKQKIVKSISSWNNSLNNYAKLEAEGTIKQDQNDAWDGRIAEQKENFKAWKKQYGKYYDKKKIPPGWPKTMAEAAAGAPSAGQRLQLVAASTTEDTTEGGSSKYFQSSKSGRMLRASTSAEAAKSRKRSGGDIVKNSKSKKPRQVAEKKRAGRSASRHKAVAAASESSDIEEEEEEEDGNN